MVAPIRVHETEFAMLLNTIIPPDKRTGVINLRPKTAGGPEVAHQGDGSRQDVQ
jgi:hypothetical protein